MTLTKQQIEYLEKAQNWEDEQIKQLQEPEYQRGWLELTLSEFLEDGNIETFIRCLKKAGVTGEALKKVKACHKLSIISYVGATLAAGLGAWAGNKIRDEICKLKTEPPVAQFEEV